MLGAFCFSSQSGRPFFAEPVRAIQAHDEEVSSAELVGVQQITV
jgi:hypothetical protein